MKKWLTHKESAKYMSLAIGTFRNYVSQGCFQYYINPMTGTKRFKQDDLDSSMIKVSAKKQPNSNMIRRKDNVMH